MKRSGAQFKARVAVAALTGAKSRLVLSVSIGVHAVGTAMAEVAKKDGWMGR
jgi:hypothetical protein